LGLLTIKTGENMKKAFTLIELLIVVAIIAILAAIAVPNFLEAQNRAKVSRAKSDMRTYATAIETYRVDNNSYPFCNTFGVDQNAASIDPTNSDPTANNASANYKVLENLTTPIAYTTSLFQDAFFAKLRTGSAINGILPIPGIAGSPPYSAQPNFPAYHRYFYQSTSETNRATLDASGNAVAGKPVAWTVYSCGPDLISTSMGGVLANGSNAPFSTIAPATSLAYDSQLIYDSTNGTISFGDIYRVGGNTGAGYATVFYQAAQQQSMK
jgi:type II secretion system protein G